MIKPIGRTVTFLLTLVFIGCNSHPNVELLVAGNKVKTFESIEQAVEASRQYTDAKTIQLAANKYFLEAPIVLNEKDKGLTIQSKTEEKAKLYGGVKITNWVKADGDFWVADLSNIQPEGWFFRSLMVDGRYAERSRYPETGRLKHHTRWTKRWLSTVEGGWEEEPNHEELTQFNFKEGDIEEWLNPVNAEITVFHSWDETLAGVESIDLENNILTTSIEVGHPMGAFGVRDYIIWNTQKGMTQPGQWYIDREKQQLVYWPLPEENMENIEVIAPVLENIFQISNTSHITLKNISVHSTTTPLIVGDFAAKMFDGAINLQESSHCVFDNLIISGSTGWGIKTLGENITIKNCIINYVGAGGIRMIGSNGKIENNHIHHVGRTYPSAIALYVGVTDPKMVDEWEYGKEKESVIISHNEVHDSPYIGIGLGGPYHIVEYNKIYRVLEEMADGAGIYATFCQNVIIRNNFVKDIIGGEHGQISSYYLDELSDNALIENNISINVSRPNHNHLCKNNVLRDNVFISEGPMTMTNPRCDNITYENNVFVSGGKFTMYHGGSSTIRNNLFDVANDEILESLYTDQYKPASIKSMKLSNGNIAAKALLSIHNDDVLFDSTSKVFSLGVKPKYGSEAGLEFDY